MFWSLCCCLYIFVTKWALRIAPCCWNATEEERRLTVVIVLCIWFGGQILELSYFDPVFKKAVRTIKIKWLIHGACTKLPCPALLFFKLYCHRTVFLQVFFCFSGSAGACDLCWSAVGTVKCTAESSSNVPSSLQQHTVHTWEQNRDVDHICRCGLFEMFKRAF